MQTPNPEHLFLRTCGPNGESYGAFVWPLKAGEKVEAPDWNDRKECGGGLHGLRMGAGYGGLLRWDADAVWIVFESDAWIDINGDKCKVESCVVRHVGDKLSATTFLIDAGCDPSRVVGATVTGGDRATVTGGYGATVTGGDLATVTGGHGATVTGGDRATVTGGDRATVTGGHGATVTGGHGATVTGGDLATVTGGHDATVTGGYGATVTGGDGATVAAGHGSSIAVKWWGESAGRHRIKVGYVGEGGIRAGVAYRLNDQHEFEAVAGREAEW